MLFFLWNSHSYKTHWTIPNFPVAYTKPKDKRHKISDAISYMNTTKAISKDTSPSTTTKPRYSHYEKPPDSNRMKSSWLLNWHNRILTQNMKQANIYINTYLSRCRDDRFLVKFKKQFNLLHLYILDSS